MSTRRGEFASAAKFLAPNFVGFAVFTIGPVVFSLCVSLTNWNLKQTVPLQFVGTDNYARLAADKWFWIYLANTAYMMLGLPVAIFGSLWLAVLLNNRLKGLTAYRTLLYLPSFTSGVAIMILWKSLLSPDFGPINVALGWLMRMAHLNPVGHLPQWLLSTHSLAGLEVEKVGFAASQLGLGARDALTMMGIWVAIGGSNMLLYLAGLSNVPPELTEAAELDGAGRWKVFRHVTWPQLAPTTFFIVVMSVIGGLQGGFEQARIMTAGGPAGTTTTISYYIYTKAFEEFRIGYASAVSWVLFGVIAIVTWMNWRYGNKAVSDVI